MQYDNGGNRGNLNIAPPGVGNADIGFDGTTFEISSNSSSAKLQLQSSSTARADFYASSGVVFNEGSNDYDFRVESNSYSNFLKVDANDNQLIIGQAGSNDGVVATVSSVAQSTHASNQTEGELGIVRFNNTQTSNQHVGLFFRVTTDNSGHNANGAISLVQPSTGGHQSQFAFNLRRGNGNRHTVAILDSDAGAIFNETGDSVLDFRVESDSYTHALFVDASR